jgi:hypothetical protein
MAELAGKSVAIKVSGTATAFVGEVTTGATDQYYQITDAAKRVLDRTETIHVLVKGSNTTTEGGTNTTTIHKDSHGLATGDVIINTTRANAKREVTYVSADEVTVTAVTSQTSGDTIERYIQAAASTYTLNRLNGKASFTTSTPRTVLISGKYLPMSTAAYANTMSRIKSIDLLDIASFGDSYKKRLAGLLHAAGTLTQLDVTDDTFNDALTAGVPIVIEDVDDSGSEPNRVWALLDQTEIAQAVADAQSNIISWVSHDEWLTLGG